MLLIKLYWNIPKSKRRRCIFKTSCSQFVYKTTKEKGFIEGLVALKFRVENCNGKFQIYEDSIDGSKKMVLQNGQIIENDEIANRFCVN